MTERTRLLVADDDESIAVTLQAILEREGYQVWTAESAERVAALAEAQEFDVAIVDLRLGGADGVELLARLHRQQPNCTAIMLTGYASLESAVGAIRQGAYDYLIKPCDLQELRHTVHRAAERTSLTRALHARVQELEAANQRIQNFNRELQGRVDEATSQLTQAVEELSKAKEELERLHQEREQFILLIAHELRQALSIVMNYITLLNRTDAESRTLLQEARDAIGFETQRVLRLVSDLSDAFSISAGRFRVHPQETDLGEIISRQVDAVVRANPEYRVAFTPPPSPLLCVCDPDRMGQVVSNLLDNAIKHSRSAQATVDIAQGRDTVSIVVQDDGVGIPEDKLTAIFEQHFRLDRANETRTPGAGLGLYIVREIVEAHGGTIRAESVEGKGTAFYVDLPRRVEGAPLAGQEALSN